MYERGVGEKESALSIKHALQLFDCVSLGNTTWKLDFIY
jgi:hypothetical protein